MKKSLVCWTLILFVLSVLLTACCGGGGGKETIVVPAESGATAGQELQDLKAAHDQLAPDILGSLRNAIENVRQYQGQIFTGKDIPGKIRYTPIERVGVCVPGASAPLLTTSTS